MLFNGLQIRLRNGLVTKDDVVLVRRLCSRHSMTAKQWKDRGFDDPNVPHLFCTNDEVSNHNARRITDLGTPIASIRASHTGRGGSAGREKARGLFASMYLAVGSKVQVNQNLATYVGICNGSTGIVKDIVYEEGVPPPGLPRFVIVDFGDQYMGESFFPDNPDRRNQSLPFGPHRTQKMEKGFRRAVGPCYQWLLPGHLLFGNHKVKPFLEMLFCTLGT